MGRAHGGQPAPSYATSTAPSGRPPTNMQGFNSPATLITAPGSAPNQTGEDLQVLPIATSPLPPERCYSSHLSLSSGLITPAWVTLGPQASTHPHEAFPSTHLQLAPGGGSEKSQMPAVLPNPCAPRCLPPGPMSSCTPYLDTPYPGLDLCSAPYSPQQSRAQDDPVGSLSPVQMVLKDGIFMRKQLLKRRLKAKEVLAVPRAAGSASQDVYCLSQLDPHPSTPGSVSQGEARLMPT